MGKLTLKEKREKANAIMKAALELWKSRKCKTKSNTYEFNQDDCYKYLTEIMNNAGELYDKA